MQKFHRGTRRHHRERLIKSRRHYYGGIEQRVEENQVKILSQWSRTPQMCSCWMCTSPRYAFGELTMQEKRFDEFACVEED